MADEIVFETPENIELSYKPAGLGTRFMAWFVDSILNSVACIVIFFVLALLAALTDSAIKDAFRDVEQYLDDEVQARGNGGQLGMIVIGVGMALWGLGSFFYFGLSELLMRGQTVGKRMAQVRVVKADGFAIDALSILVRSIFRMVDQLPPFWLVPLLSGKSRRFGDMVAGTLVVSDGVTQLSRVREHLSVRKAEDAQFRFDVGQLKRLRDIDWEAIERLLERWPEIDPQRRQTLLKRLCAAVVARLEIEPPPEGKEHPFFSDLLAAEYRRQARQLG